LYLIYSVAATGQKSISQMTIRQKNLIYITQGLVLSITLCLLYDGVTNDQKSIYQMTIGQKAKAYNAHPCLIEFYYVFNLLFFDKSLKVNIPYDN